MKLKDIIAHYKKYMIVCYALILVGIIFTSIYNNNSIKNFLLIINCLLSFSLPILNIIIVSVIKKDKNNIPNYIKFEKIFGMIALILIPIITSNYVYYTISPNINYSYTILIINSFVISLVYTNNVRILLFDEEPILNNQLFGLVITILILPLPNIFTYLLTEISIKLLDLIAVLIAIIMLSVSLSALTFSYCSILPYSDKKTNMIKNGEGYFVSSILSLFYFILFIILLILNQNTHFMKITNLNIVSYDFVLLNAFSLVSLLFLILIIYSIFYLLKYSFRSLKEFKEILPKLELK